MVLQKVVAISGGGITAVAAGTGIYTIVSKKENKCVTHMIPAPTTTCEDDDVENRVRN